MIPTEDEIRDELARRRLLDFTVRTFVDGDAFDVNWHHEAIAAALERWAFGDLDRLILTVPPQHSKSTLASRHGPAWILGRDPDARIIETSYAADLAVSFSRDVKRIIKSDAYARIFPGTRISEKHVATDERGESINRADEWEVVGHRGRYIARGVGGATTGRGAKYLIVDDPFKDAEEARSAVYRDRVWRWYNQVLRTRGSADCRILVIMTRWHEDDLVGRLLEDARTKPDADQWTVVNLPAIAEPDAPDYDPRQPGEALWPAFKDEAYWAGVRAVDPDGFASLGQQRPAPEGGAIVRGRWLLDNAWQRLPDPHGRWIVVCDPKAGSKNKRSSRCVLQLWTVPQTEPGRGYLVDQVRGIWDSEETLAVFLLHAGRDYDHLDLPHDFRRELAVMRVSSSFGMWRLATEWHVEDKADGRSTVRTLQSRIPGMLLWSAKGRGKEDRLRACVPLFASGSVRARADAPWLDEWIHELTTFPAAASDDQVDTTTMALDVLLGPDTMAVDTWDGWFDDGASLGF